MAESARRPAMKKVNTIAAKQTTNFSPQSLTIGLDLGDRWRSLLCAESKFSQALQKVRKKLRLK
jgi:hypothetical protein